MVEIYSPYFTNRILNGILGKNKRNSLAMKEPPIPKSNITKLNENKYKVRSSKNTELAYYVDVENGTCTCPDGCSGKMCKHHLSVLMHEELSSKSMLLFTSTAEEKLKYCKLAVGAASCPSIEFFKSMKTCNISENSNDAVVASDLVEPDPTAEGYSSSEEFIDGGLAVTEKHHRKLEEKHVDDLLSQTMSLMKKKFGSQWETVETAEALEKFNSRLNAIQTPAQLMSLLHASHSDSLPRRNGGRRIRCQPTAISRRQCNAPRGAAPLGKGRRPSCVSVPSTKRPRNLAYNVERNQANAKTH